MWPKVWESFLSFLGWTSRVAVMEMAEKSYELSNMAFDMALETREKLRAALDAEVKCRDEAAECRRKLNELTETLNLEIHERVRLSDELQIVKRKMAK